MPLRNYGVGAWPCARPVEGDHKGTPLQPHNRQRGGESKICRADRPDRFHKRLIRLRPSCKGDHGSFTTWIKPVRSKILVDRACANQSWGTPPNPQNPAVIRIQNPEFRNQNQMREKTWRNNIGTPKCRPSSWDRPCNGPRSAVCCCNMHLL